MLTRRADCLKEGRKLFGYLKGRLKLEIKWTVLGGEGILTKIEANNYNVLQQRPVLKKKDFLILLLKSFV